MTPLIIVGGIAGGLLLISLSLRINAIFLFIAVAAGELLSRYIGDSAGVALSGFTSTGHVDIIGYIFLLWIPILLAILFLRKTLPPPSMLLQIVPLVFTSAAAALLTLGILTNSFQQAVYNSPIGHQLNNVQGLVIAGSGVSTFLLILLIGRPHHDNGKHHKHH